MPQRRMMSGMGMNIWWICGRVIIVISVLSQVHILITDIFENKFYWKNIFSTTQCFTLSGSSGTDIDIQNISWTWRTFYEEVGCHSYLDKQNHSQKYLKIEPSQKEVVCFQCKQCQVHPYFLPLTSVLSLLSSPSRDQNLKTSWWLNLD